MSFRPIVLVALTMFAACSSDATAPASSADTDQVSLVVARLVDTSSANAIDVGFGVNPADSVFGYGLSQLYAGEPTLGVVLEAAETVSLAVSANGVHGIFSNGKTQTSVRVTSYWQPVNPEQHPGVKYSSSLETIFQVSGYQYDPLTDAYVALPNLFFSEMTTVSNPSIIQDLPLENNTLRYPYFAQRRQITCTGTDSLLFHGTSGISVTTTDAYTTTTQVVSVPDVVVYCSVYQNVSDARAALHRMRGE